MVDRRKKEGAKMENDIAEIILGELREHRKESAKRHEAVETRVRSLEETRSEGRGVMRVVFVLAGFVSTTISLIISYIRG